MTDALNISFNAFPLASSFPKKEREAILIVTTVSSILSIFGSLFIIFNAIRLGKVKIMYWRLITCLSCVDFILAFTEGAGALAQLLGFSLSVPLCQTQGWSVEVFENASAYYVLAIAFTANTIIVKKHLRWSLRTELIAHTLIWTISLSLGLIPLISDDVSYVPSGSWCWVAPSPNYARFVLLYAIVWIILVVIIGIYVKIWFSIRKPNLAIIVNVEKQKKRNKLFRQLILFPLGFAIIWIPPSINRAQEAYGKPIFALVFLESMWLPLQGFLNWIFYGLTSNVLKKTHFEEKKPLISGEERKELIDVNQRLHDSLYQASINSDGSFILPP